MGAIMFPRGLGRVLSVILPWAGLACGTRESVVAPHHLEADFPRVDIWLAMARS